MRKWMLVAAALAMLVLGTVAAVGAQSARVPGDAIPACTEEQLDALADVIFPIYNEFLTIAREAGDISQDNLEDFITRFSDVHNKWLTDGFSSIPACAAAYELGGIYNLLSGEALVYVLSARAAFNAEAAGDDDMTQQYNDLVTVHGSVTAQVLTIFGNTLIAIYPDAAVTPEP